MSSKLGTNGNRRAPDNTGEKQGPAPPFQPGQSGNPAGRPKGSRNKLSEAFLAALADDFATHGTKVIEQVRAEKPDQYLKVIASVLPKEIHGDPDHRNAPTDYTDADLLEIIRLGRSDAEDGDVERDLEGLRRRLP